MLFLILGYLACIVNVNAEPIQVYIECKDAPVESYLTTLDLIVVSFYPEAAYNEGNGNSLKVNLDIIRDSIIWKTFEKLVSSEDKQSFPEISLPVGTIQFQVSALNFETWISEEYIVEEAALKLKMMPLAKNSFIFVPNNYCFELTDQNLNVWNHSLLNVTCRTEDYSTLPYEPEFCFSHTFKDYGSQNLQVFCDNNQYSFPVYVTKLSIVMEKFDKPIFSSDYMNITFKLIYNQTSEFTSTEVELNIEIELKESPIKTGQNCSGLVTKGVMKTKFYHGRAEFKKINILSNGYFIIVPHCESFEISPSPSFSVTNFIKKVEFITAVDPIHFSWLEVQLRVSGDDDLNFVRETTTNVSFKNFYCEIKFCIYQKCWYCLPMRLNETVTVIVIDKAFNTFKYNLTYNYKVLENPRAKVVFRIYNENENGFLYNYNNYYQLNSRYPFPAMSYDRYSVQVFITNNGTAYNRIPCFMDNGYIQRICVSERCSNGVKVQNFSTLCFKDDYKFTRSYTSLMQMDSVGDYVYHAPFINDLSGSSRVINMSSFISQINITNTSTINALENSALVLNLYGPDGFYYIKQNDIEIKSSVLAEPLKMRVVKGYQEFVVNFNEAGTYVFDVSSSHMKKETSINVTVDKPKEVSISGIEIMSVLYIYENFTIKVTLSNYQGEISSCLLKLDPQIELISTVSNIKYILKGNEYCENGKYSISNLTFNNTGDYKLIIKSAIAISIIPESQVSFKEKILDAVLTYPQIIKKNQPFELSVKLKTSSSTYYNPDSSLIIESISIFGQKSSKYTQKLSSFYIYSDTEGLITVNLIVLDNNFTKTFNLSIQPNNEKQLIINIIPLSNSTELSLSSDIFNVELNTSSSIDLLNYQIELYPIGITSGLVIEGVIELESNETRIVFENLKIISAGTFLVVAKSSDGFLGISKETLTVMNKVLNLTLECNSEEPAFTEIYFIVYVFGEDGNYFIGNIEVNLNATQFIGNSSINTSNGIAIFKGYFSELVSPIIYAQINNSEFSDSKPLVVINHEFEPVFEEISPIVIIT